MKGGGSGVVGAVIAVDTLVVYGNDGAMLGIVAVIAITVIIAIISIAIAIAFTAAVTVAVAVTIVVAIAVIVVAVSDAIVVVTVAIDVAVTITIAVAVLAVEKKERGFTGWGGRMIGQNYQHMVSSTGVLGDDLLMFRWCGVGWGPSSALERCDRRYDRKKMKCYELQRRENFLEIRNNNS